MTGKPAILPGICLLILLLGACTYFQPREEKPKGTAIARVYDDYLYEQDIKGLGLSGQSPEDSMRLVNEYINNWINQRLLLRYAEKNLPERLDDIEKQVEDYRQSLLIYTYQTQYINQHLDTAVPASMIQAWYQDHADNFQLEKNIIRLRYLILPPEPPRQDSLKIWIKSDNPDYLDRLQLFAIRHARRYNLNDSLWFDEEVLRKNLPDPVLHLIKSRQTGLVEYKDSTGLFMVYLLDLKIKGKTAPLSYVRETMRKIILNKRKMEMLNELSEQIRTDAARRNDFEMYKKEE